MCVCVCVLSHVCVVYTILNDSLCARLFIKPESESETSARSTMALKFHRHGSPFEGDREALDGGVGKVKSITEVELS